MKYAISTDSKTVCPHFGRAPEFTFITVDEGKIKEREILPNPGHTIGGIPEFIKKHEAKFMVTGGMGHRAVEIFQQYGIKVITGVSGSIDEVIERILDGTLVGGESFCAPGKGKGYGVEKIHTDADDLNYHHHH